MKERKLLFFILIAFFGYLPLSLIHNSVNNIFAYENDDIKELNLYTLEEYLEWYNDNFPSNKTNQSVIKLAILDTGIDTTNTVQQDSESKINLVNDNINVNDDNGHGTAIAGIIKGIAKNSVHIISCKVLDKEGKGDYDKIADAIYWAANQNAKIINVSFTGNNYSQKLQNAINYAWDHGSIIIAPVGNDGIKQDKYPASNNYVLAVGSVNKDGLPSEFSNPSESIGLATLGEEIISILPNFIYEKYPKTGGFTKLSGTSFSSAILSGIIALYWSENPQLDNKDVIRNIEQKSSAGSWNNRTGFGIVNLEVLTRAIPEKSKFGIVRGQITDKIGQPLSGINMHFNGKSVSSNENGFFYVRDIPEGLCAIKVNTINGLLRSSIKVYGDSENYFRFIVENDKLRIIE